MASVLELGYYLEGNSVLSVPLSAVKPPENPSQDKITVDPYSSGAQG